MNINNKTIELLRSSKYCIAYTGAGISVESGVPCFRGKDGLGTKYDSNLFELNYYTKYPEISWPIIREIFFYKFFNNAHPNRAHITLARMEKAGILKTVITQNIDNLHQMAGNKNIFELHGHSHTFMCIKCNAKYKINEINLSALVPYCKQCSGLLRPNFIFFGEEIPETVYSQSFAEAISSDILLMIGISGVDAPSSYIPYEAKKNGSVIIEINPVETIFTKTITDIFLQGKATEILAQIAYCLMQIFQNEKIITKTKNEI